MSCWKCHEAVDGPVCVGCGAVQPLAGEADHYGVLGLARRYHLDVAAVEDAWRRRSRLVHPDRFAKHPAVERRMSLQWTAAVNEARRVLRDPLRRARFLVSGKAEPEGKGGPSPDADFLELMFELQFEAASDPEGVRARVTGLHEAAMAELDAVFSRWEAEAAPAAASLQPAGEILARLKYLDTALLTTAGSSHS